VLLGARPERLERFFTAGALKARLDVLLRCATRVGVRELNGTVHHDTDRGCEWQWLVPGFRGICCELAFTTHRCPEEGFADPEAALGPQRQRRAGVFDEVGA
jgi:hypothetical protein